MAASYIPRFLRHGGRRLLRRLRGLGLEIVYHELYNASFPGLPNDPLRGERILAFLASEALISKCCVHQPKPLWLKTLEQVHAAAYLESLHDPQTLQSIFGVDVTVEQVDRLIDLQRLQSAGTVLAAQLARSSRHLAINLGGGFHHAHAGQGGGFCLFNDIALAVFELRRRGLKKRVLVVDLDVHDGDGTRAIFAEDSSVYTYSIHAESWDETAAVSSLSIALGSRVDDAAYVSALSDTLPKVVRDFDPGFIFYLAGCDPAHDDELADWRITPEGMLERDRLVIAQSHRGGSKHIPTVVILAGGYGHQAWRYTARFLSDHLRRGVPLEPPSTEAITLRRYRYLVRLFEPAELTGGSASNEFGITEEDLFLPSWGMMKETRFLGYFSRHGVELVLERSGFLDRLRDLGYSHPTLDFQLSEAAGQTVRIYAEPEKKQVLTELRVQRDRRSLPGMELLSIEWLLLQNPRLDFQPGRGRLPGQEHPGLGLLRDVVAMLVVACELTHLDGLIFVPSQFHIAAQWQGHLFFLDPETRARFAALRELFQDMPMSEASRAIAGGRVVDVASEEVFRWRPEPMILPVSEALEEQAAKLAERREAGAMKHAFRLLAEVSVEHPLE